MGIIGKSVSLTLLALLCFSSSVFTLGVNQPGLAPDHLTLPPSPPPVKAPIKLPTLPPTKAPIKLPALPPAKAPIKLPTLPPAKAPIKLPTLPPAKAPIKLPTLPPTKAPIKPPVLPPLSPPKFNRTLVAVRGLVYCKPCKYAGVNTLIGAKPVKDAVVRLVCKNKKSSISETKTDKNGYFMFLAPKTVTSYGIKGCRAFLVKSPDAKCSKVSTLHGGDKGAYLKPVVKPGNSTTIINKFTYGIYNVGPFAFDPACPK
ncbi:PREDICTED: non-classical arabinogalactan protein 30-like isoform X2 [Camelina sativa]|uniref:Non-classical arabinogalactan protein 30-like isoform X1 n=1 Tax=Camelina sativa TaxID=90675 RepID=A0ABM0SNG4_CAMSA|nr:PREDICTED: non-classical arabinogalactan protein 30-like isoform X1 [Camelina sativa]XP_019082953.1 PREDICTED: non-classical arabinogalactan protein 30-like isoform X2 [Camelina sativa]